MTTALAKAQGPSLLEKFSVPLGVSPTYFKEVVKATVLKTKDRPATDEELVMFLAIADRYGLDVWTKQIHAFVDKGAIVPIVGIDGWNYLENNHPDFAGEKIETPPMAEWERIDKDAKLCPAWMRVLIYHKGREHPTDHTEYLDECYQPPRNNFKGPWQTHTKRMLRHKARIQAIREAFGFGGIYDEDEAERIIHSGEVIDVAPSTNDAGEVIGSEQYEALTAEMHRTGTTEATACRNLELKAHYTGELCDMPVPVYDALMTGLMAMPTVNPPADSAAPATETAESGDEGALPGMDAQTRADAQRERAAETRSPSEMAADLLAKAEATEQAKVIATRDVNWIATQATIHGIGDDELYQWVIDKVGVERLEDIPAVHLDDVKAWIESREVASGAAS